MIETVRQGRVDWTGDNPFIYLKEDPATEWTALSLYFRVAASAHGRGHAILVLERPYEPGAKGAHRLCLTDNRALARFLIDGFVKKFALFRPASALLDGLEIVMGADFRTEADHPAIHTERASTAGGRSIAMTWERLGPPFAVDVPPEKSQTAAHEMFSVFQPAAGAHVAVGGKRIAGTTVERDFFGGRAQSAALAFSETWVRAKMGSE